MQATPGRRYDGTSWTTSLKAVDHIFARRRRSGAVRAAPFRIQECQLTKRARKPRRIAIFGHFDGTNLGNKSPFRRFCISSVAFNQTQR